MKKNKKKRITYQHFLGIIMGYKKFTDDMHDLYNIGIDLCDSKYKLCNHIEDMLQNSLQSHYTKEGVDWIEWFIYESEYGTRDWSSSPTYKRNANDEIELIHETGDVHWGATDENGDPICYSFESLYEYVRQYEK